jgi:hypothetical protein
MDLDIPALLNNGGIIALLSAFLAYFINAYKNEVNDHKDTLKEMAMVRQKQEDVKSVVETWKSRRDVIEGGGGI